MSRVTCVSDVWNVMSLLCFFWLKAADFTLAFDTVFSGFSSDAPCPCHGRGLLSENAKSFTGKECFDSVLPLFKASAFNVFVSVCACVCMRACMCVCVFVRWCGCVCWKDFWKPGRRSNGCFTMAVFFFTLLLTSNLWAPDQFGEPSLMPPDSLASQSCLGAPWRLKPVREKPHITRHSHGRGGFIFATALLSTFLKEVSDTGLQS